MRPSCSANGRNPVGVGTPWRGSPRVASRTRQPWAGGRNPFGIGARALPPHDGRSALWVATFFARLRLRYRPAPPLNPNGIPAQSPGLRAASYSGEIARRGPNPNGVATVVLRKWAQLQIVTFGTSFDAKWHYRWGWDPVARFTQGSLADSATLGWRTQSLWDCRVTLNNLHWFASKEQ